MSPDPVLLHLFISVNKNESHVDNIATRMVDNQLFHFETWLLLDLKIRYIFYMHSLYICSSDVSQINGVDVSNEITISN